ncbi:hsp70-Hsp90 organizing protein 3-like [Papaver somniferum]|uniref:hsp70-Hsp90 organizing protein 3-like n=1 Tax=Papaver somniferum TaxID=3469 RepID=UPI000E6F5C68|nr:hsp70-Hsp90 organizing protein 3-like [Papaver somniferum]XP_026418676.1 hsp70-Hsp90 organizing protein 3-like [Papaver somniferum]XP_026418682.1 hsp70-Hsp90 organizing protein 3-like [Papaver somniferum]
MRLLLQAGADPNAVSYGETPLISAAILDGGVEEVTHLLEAGADPNYKSNRGVTPLEIAAMKCDYKIVEVLFPVTSRIPTYPDWSITGLMRHVNSAANKMQREAYAKEQFHQAKSKGIDAFQGEQYVMALHLFREASTIFPKDAAVLSNLSACYARLDEGDDALYYATLCMHVRPEWPKAYYRMGVANNLLERYDEAADAFEKGLTLDPENKELKDAYMKAIEAKLNSLQV